MGDNIVVLDLFGKVLLMVQKGLAEDLVLFLSLTNNLSTEWILNLSLCTLFQIKNVSWSQPTRDQTCGMSDLPPCYTCTPKLNDYVQS